TALVGERQKGTRSGPPPLAVAEQLSELGERLRAEIIASSAQAEARLARDREALRQQLDEAVKRQRQVASTAVTRDDLRQLWTEIATRLGKQQEAIAAQQAQLRRELAERLERLELSTAQPRSEEHTSELQSRENLVCRLLL